MMTSGTHTTTTTATTSQGVENTQSIVKQSTKFVVGMPEDRKGQHISTGKDLGTVLYV